MWHGLGMRLSINTPCVTMVHPQEPGLFHQWSFYLAGQFQGISQGEPQMIHCSLTLPDPTGDPESTFFVYTRTSMVIVIAVPIFIMQTTWLSLSSLLRAPSCKAFPQKWYWWNHHYIHTHVISGLMRYTRLHCIIRLHCIAGSWTTYLWWWWHFGLATLQGCDCDCQ